MDGCQPQLTDDCVIEVMKHASCTDLLVALSVSKQFHRISTKYLNANGPLIMQQHVDFWLDEPIKMGNTSFVKWLTESFNVCPRNDSLMRCSEPALMRWLRSEKSAVLNITALLHHAHRGTVESFKCVLDFARGNPTRPSEYGGLCDAVIKSRNLDKLKLYREYGYKIPTNIWALVCKANCDISIAEWLIANNFQPSGSDVRYGIVNCMNDIAYIMVNLVGFHNLDDDIKSRVLDMTIFTENGIFEAPFWRSYRISGVLITTTIKSVKVLDFLLDCDCLPIHPGFITACSPEVGEKLIKIGLFNPELSFWKAITTGNLQMIKWIHERGFRGDNKYMMSAVGFPEILEYLLDNGYTAEGGTDLLFGAIDQKQHKSVKILVEKGFTIVGRHRYAAVRGSCAKTVEYVGAAHMVSLTRAVRDLIKGKNIDFFTMFIQNGTLRTYAEQSIHYLLHHVFSFHDHRPLIMLLESDDFAEIMTENNNIRSCERWPKHVVGYVISVARMQHHLRTMRWIIRHAKVRFL